MHGGPQRGRGKGSGRGGRGGRGGRESESEVDPPFDEAHELYALHEQMAKLEVDFQQLEAGYQEKIQELEQQRAQQNNAHQDQIQRMIGLILAQDQHSKAQIDSIGRLTRENEIMRTQLASFTKRLERLEGAPQHRASSSSPIPPAPKSFAARGSIAAGFVSAGALLYSSSSSDEESPPSVQSPPPPPPDPQAAKPRREIQPPPLPSPAKPPALPNHRSSPGKSGILTQFSYRRKEKKAEKKLADPVSAKQNNIQNRRQQLPKLVIP